MTKTDKHGNFRGRRKKTEERNAMKLKDNKQFSFATVPEHLNEHGKTVWKFWGHKLAEMQSLTSVDYHLFELLCEAYGSYRHCIDVLKEEPNFFQVEDRAGGIVYRAHPAVKERDECFKRLRQSLYDFREILNAGLDDNDPLKKFLKEK